MRLVLKVVLCFYGRTMVVTEPICSIKLDIGNSEVWEWVAFDLIVLSIANEGAFTESFGMLATVLSSATSSLKLVCLPSAWTTWEEKETQDPPAHLAVDEHYQCSEAHTAPAEVEDLVTNHGWRQHQETTRRLLCISSLLLFAREWPCKFTTIHLPHSCHWRSRRTRYKQL